MDLRQRPLPSIRPRGKNPAWPTPADDPLARVPLQPDQETVAEHDKDSVAMKAVPQPARVLIPTQQALGFFTELLNPITSMGVLHQGCQGCVRWEVAPEVIPVTVAAGGSLADQPANVAVSITIDTAAADGGELGAQPTLAPFSSADGLPLPARQNTQNNGIECSISQVRRVLGLERRLNFD